MDDYKEPLADVDLEKLKERYFKLLKRENIPHTKKITKMLDEIELEIIKREKRS